jgi:DNA-binding Lrp family transcriptional regulator
MTKVVLRIAMTGLDKIDMMILSNLQNNGRVTNVELAANAGISAPPCLRRLKLMEEDGVIQGYHASVNPHVLGYELKAFCIIFLMSQNTEKINNFVNKITSLKNIRSCFSSPGNEVFVLSIIAKDLKEYETILRNEIQCSDMISRIKTYILANVHKDEYGIPIDF